MQHFALTIIGRDRPGIVSQVTELLFRGGFNIADSSCSILGGQFSMILIISNPDISTTEQFSDTFKPLEENNLSVYIRTLKEGGEIRSELNGELCMIQCMVPTNRESSIRWPKSWEIAVSISPT